MAQYINKDALIAEIERLDTLYHTSKSLSGDLFIQGLFCFVDTFKVKEVDLEKERRNMNGTLYYVYPLNWMCLTTANNFPCEDCKCFGGREGNNILCAVNWADKPDPNDNYSL